MWHWLRDKTTIRDLKSIGVWKKDPIKQYETIGKTIASGWLEKEMYLVNSEI